jgi:hypothetical protein
MTLTTAPATTTCTKPAAAVGTGLEPVPGSPEALLLLAGLGVLPASAANVDPRFSPEAITTCIERLLEVKQQQDLLGAEQKELHEQLRLAHLRGDLAQLLPAGGKDGNGYQISPSAVLFRRPGRKQWTYSLACAELDCQLKARQAYEQQSGDASCSYGASFWEVRAAKG